MNPIAAAQQFRAIAYLRWCLFRSGFRRKGGKGELAARFVLYPLFSLFILGPLAGAVSASYAAVSTGHLDRLAFVFWAIFALRVVVSVNLAQPGLSFDPESLIRFPLTFTRYLVIRVVLGLLSASTIIATLCLLGAATGISLADHTLAPAAFAAALVLALCDMFLIRMIFAWVDRWLSTRRARELFTGLIIAVSLGIQYLNFTYNPGLNHSRGHRAQSAAGLSRGLHLYNAAEPALRHLPAGLATSAIVSSAAGHVFTVLADYLGILLFAAVFLAIFAWRMQREYRGENLSEANNSPVLATSAAPQRVASAASITPIRGTTNALLPPTVAACLYKEWIYLRRNTAQFYGLLAPIAMVFLFTLRVGGSMAHSAWLFPAAVAYSALGIAALAYNSLGLDAAGVQFYFFAPVHFGDVLLAKNLFSCAVNLVEFALILGLISYTAGPPRPLVILGTLLWLVAASFVNLTVGNRRSITSPKKMDPSKLSRRQASQLSALLSVGLMLALIAVGGACNALAAYLNLPWLPPAVFGILAVAAFFLYRSSLRGIDNFALNHRQTMIEELAKAS